MQDDWPIFILSLAGDEQRRQPLLDQLAAAGLEWRIILGVDGRHGLQEHCLALIDREAASRRLGYTMVDAEFACALSHRQIYQTVLDEGLSGAVVLEDDAILTPDFAVFLQAGHHRVARIALLDYRFGRALLWQKRALGRWCAYRAAQRATLTSGYSISRHGAEDLLAAATPVSFVADWPIDLYEFGAELIVPRVVLHNPPGVGPSHLDAGRSTVAKARGKDPMRYLRSEYWRCLLRRKLSRPVGR